MTQRHLYSQAWGLTQSPTAHMSGSIRCETIRGKMLVDKGGLEHADRDIAILSHMRTASWTGLVLLTMGFVEKRMSWHAIEGPCKVAL